MLCQDETERIEKFIISNIDESNVFEVWDIDSANKKFEPHVKNFLANELKVIESGHKRISKLIIEKFEVLLNEFSDLCTPEKILKITSIWLTENATSFEDFSKMVKKLKQLDVFDKVSWKCRYSFYDRVATE